MIKDNKDIPKESDFDVKTSEKYSKGLERQARILQKAQEKVDSSLKRNIDILNNSMKYLLF
jgi:hypothetical protein